MILNELSWKLYCRSDRVNADQEEDGVGSKEEGRGWWCREGIKDKVFDFFPLKIWRHFLENRRNRIMDYQFGTDSSAKNGEAFMMHPYSSWITSVRHESSGDADEEKLSLGTFRQVISGTISQALHFNQGIPREENTLWQRRGKEWGRVHP